MSDYIKREDAIERLSYHADFYQNDREFGGEEMLYKDSALNEISELPSADVVEVVRCKDCRWWGYLDEKGSVRVCHAAKHEYKSRSWDIDIYRRHNGEFYCADGEKE